VDRLDTRQLNRATLDRQLLLRRADLPARTAIGHLAGLQAQAPLAPYVGLWTRLAEFAHEDLRHLLTERAVVRAHLMRNTIHLLNAPDFTRFRPLYQPIMDRALAGHFGPRLAGVDLTELRTVAAALLSQTPLTRSQLAGRLSPRWPAHDPAALAYAATHLLHLVQVPPRGLWGRTAPATWFLASAWLDAETAPAAYHQEDEDWSTTVDHSFDRPPLDDLVLRYLAAYGPATVNDIQAWSGLTRLREVTDRLSARLRPFTGPDGAELLDLPDAPRPDPDVPAPPRFLPEYDNLLLSFADRSRVIRGARAVPLPPGNGATTGTLLADGWWAGEWTISRGPDRATLEIRPFGPLAEDAVAAEGRRLLEFAAPAAAHDVRFAPPHN